MRLLWKVCSGPKERWYEMKIAVIGYSGSGKSTLSRRLGRRFKLPVLFLDQVHWLPGWKEQEPREEAFQVEAFMDDHDS